MTTFPEAWSILRCPLTGQGLTAIRGANLSTLVGHEPRLTGRDGVIAPAGEFATLLVRDDRATAYAVIDGVPILLAPERITVDGPAPPVDLNDPRYAEAYAEMTHYNQLANEKLQTVDLRQSASPTMRNLARLAVTPEAERRKYPEPLADWVDSRFEVAAEGDVHRLFRDICGKRVLQLGGSGTGAIKLLLAGAREAWLVTPVTGEISVARQVAEYCGVAERLHCVAGIAEELPFADETFDFVWASGCVHHMVTAIALPESARVLAANGRFGAVEPWRAPGYGLGIRILGQRESGATCRPLTGERVSPFFTAFPRSKVIHHGALSRYALIALEKAGIAASPKLVWRITRLDDRVSSLIPAVRRAGSSTALLGIKVSD